ncbi:DUF421 domain-containing protein [Bacillus vallismortis]|uniref:DUF421 domain-containing protein n=1 Tax=Bacillus vallismortis TaxID=72361 RepID=UPI002280ACAC|nr:DUF421 domain-containing protein [Bacillus vallismortis]MCI4135716.1 DUF421 domain-containing protein [Bacillus vallismortis]MCY7894261.1 DUF421 domain-containing protein [Bacillus vallismortis]
MLWMVWAFLLKPVIIFSIAYILFRLAGKKAVSQMNNFDLLLTFAIGTIISEPILTSRLPMSIYYAGAFLVLYLLVTKLSLSNKWRWLLVVSPTVLIRNGDIDEQGLRKERLTVNELFGKLREKGYADPADIDLAIIEETGEVSVIPKEEARAVQVRDLNMEAERNFIPIPLILDGEILDHNLKYLQKNRSWLFDQLEEKGYSPKLLSSVTLGTMNAHGDISLDVNSSNGPQHDPYLYKPGNNN